MKKIDEKHYIWAEKYRPQTIEDLIVPAHIKQQLLSWVKDGEIPNIGIWGNTPGLGKTSMTTALTKELDSSILWINASKDGGVDTFRGKIASFASTEAMDGRPKIVVLDEADNLTAVVNGAQYAVRGDIETYAKNCRFILTGNYKERVIKPVLNRLSNFDFDEIFAKYKTEIGTEIYKRLKWILENEGVEYNVSDVQQIIKNFYPSIREMTMFMQKSVIEKKLVIDARYSETDKIKEAVIHNTLKRDFREMLKSVNEMTDPSSLYTYIYKHMETLLEEGQSRARMILLLSKYMDLASRARDEHINVAAFCTECMQDINIKFKGQE